jgi:hypothetical protein
MSLNFNYHALHKNNLKIGRYWIVNSMCLIDVYEVTKYGTEYKYILSIKYIYITKYNL